jgi:16S rRNA (uracil1498-N3)-methyltransferase
MAMPWFHLDSIPPVDSAAFLDGKEAKHALGARRLAPGDHVVLFDGHGTTAEAVLTGNRAVGGDLEVEVGDAVRVPLPGRCIELAASLPKGDRMSTMLDMATQLGVTSFRPLNCDFSVVTKDRKRQDPTDRWRRVMLEACKQSRRAWIPKIRHALTLGEAVEDARSRGAMVVMGDADGGPASSVAASAELVVVLVGPEGGFSPDEFEMLRARKVIPVRIGDGVLRVETAAVAIVAALHSD